MRQNARELDLTGNDALGIAGGLRGAGPGGVRFPRLPEGRPIREEDETCG